jgi:ankyrin repeat protein
MKHHRTGRRCVLAVAFAIASVAAAPTPDVRLATAARAEDWNTVRALLEQGADPNGALPDGMTALHWAVYRDNDESVGLLTKAGASVNAANVLGVTPLWAACENGSSVIVRRLLDTGANPNATLPSGETVLMTAARTGNADVVRQLLDRGARVNVTAGRGQTALMWAVAQRHPDVVAALLDHGADVRARSVEYQERVRTETSTKAHGDYIFDMQQGGYSPLLFAARVGDLASAKLLVAAGADVNDKAPYGTTATVVAAHSGYGEIVTFLLEQGANPNDNGAGYSALHAAILRQDEQAVTALLAHGADPNAPVLRFTAARRGSRDYYLHPAFVGATPFWLAARLNHQTRIMKLLADHGADPRFVHRVEHWVSNGGYELSRNNEGPTTSLMAALGMGGRVSFGEDGPDAGPAARQAPMLEAVKLAVQLGVDVNAANTNGDTALHFAATRGYETILTFLAANGARLDERNKKGQTPLAAALAGPRPPKGTIDILRKLGAAE